jgi:hypothetical protein
VAEFGLPGSQAFLATRDPIDVLADTDYSIELWFKSSHLHCGDLLSLLAIDLPPASERNALLLQLEGARGRPGSPFTNEHPGTIRFLHRDPPGATHLTGTSCFSDGLYRLRRWQHLVAVKEGVEMRMYLDGKLVGHATDKSTLASRLRLLVGREAVAHTFWQFVGQLDELAIYTRALAPSEVQRHFDAVDWSQRDPGKLTDDLISWRMTRRGI